MQSLSAAFDGDAAELADAGMLANLLNGMRKLEVACQQPGRTETAKHRVAQELQPFLGVQATDTILHDVAEGSLLSSVEAALTLFLGCRAATNLVSHIVDRAIVRI